MKTIGMNFFMLFLILIGGSISTEAKQPEGSLVKVGDGYAATSVNTAVFRGSSLATHGDTQYISYYDPEGYVVLGKRKLGTDDWTLTRLNIKEMLQMPTM